MNECEQDKISSCSTGSLMWARSLCYSHLQSSVMSCVLACVYAGTGKGCNEYSWMLWCFILSLWATEARPSLTTTMKAMESIKKRKYSKRILNDKHASFHTIDFYNKGWYEQWGVFSLNCPSLYLKNMMSPSVKLQHVSKERLASVY